MGYPRIVAKLAVWIAMLVACGRLRFDPLSDPSADAGGASGRVLYAVAKNPDQVFAYSVGTEGSLTELPGSPVATKVVDATSIAVDAQNQYAIVGGSGPVGSVSLASFAIGPTGLPVQIVDSDFTAAQSWSIAFEPTGRSFYTGTGAGIAQFFFDRATGAITPGPTTSVTATARYAFLDPQGKRLLVPGDGLVCGLEVSSIDGTTGALSMPQYYAPSQCIGDANVVAFDPAGRYIYVCDQQFQLWGFPYDASAGTIAIATPLPTMPFDVGCFGLTMHPSGRQLYSPSGQSGANAGVYAMTIDPTGGVAFSSPTAGTPNRYHRQLRAADLRSDRGVRILHRRRVRGIRVLGRHGNGHSHGHPRQPVCRGRQCDGAGDRAAVKQGLASSCPSQHHQRTTRSRRSCWARQRRRR